MGFFSLLLAAHRARQTSIFQIDWFLKETPKLEIRDPRADVAI